MIEVCFFGGNPHDIISVAAVWISKRYLDLRMLDAKGKKFQ